MSFSSLRQNLTTKHLVDAKEWVAEENVKTMHAPKTRKDTYDKRQSLEYEINTLFTECKLPLTSRFRLFLGTNHLSVKSSSYLGLGSEHHSHFPKPIFVL